MTLDEDLIPRHDLLLQLEGESVKQPVPKNIYNEDIVISTNVALLQQARAQSRIDALTMLKISTSVFLIQAKICLPSQDVLRK